MIHIRQYSTADHDYVWRMHLLVTSKAGLEATHKHYHDILNIERQYLKSGGDFFVGTDHQEYVIAMGGLKRLDDNLAEIQRLCVHPHFQQRGYGRMMLHRLEQRAEELGFRHIYLDVPTDRQYAHRLIRDSGYEIDGSAVIDGFDMTLYQKRLGARIATA